MKAAFIQEVIENEDLPRFFRCFTGWEAVVFELEDEADDRHPERSEGSQLT